MLRQIIIQAREKMPLKNSAIGPVWAGVSFSLVSASSISASAALVAVAIVDIRPGSSPYATVPLRGGKD